MGVISKDPVDIQHSFLCLRAAFLLWPGSMYHTRHTEGTERGISRRTSGYKACSTREQEALSSQALHMAVCFLVAIRLDRQGGTYTAQTQAPRGSSRPRASATEIEQAGLLQRRGLEEAKGPLPRGYPDKSGCTQYPAIPWIA